MTATLKYPSKNHTKEEPSPLKRPLHQKATITTTPVEKAVTLDNRKYLLSKTDPAGNIEYCNDYFCQITGYTEHELMGQPHSIVRHPDMPSAIFYMMWEHLRQKKNITLILKNMTKKGHFYWIQTEINIKINRASNEIIGYFAYQKHVPQHVIDTLQPLYAQLSRLEQRHDMEAAVAYLQNFLQQRGQSYEQYIHEVLHAGTFAYRLSRLKKKIFTNQREKSTLLD